MPEGNDGGPGDGGGEGGGEGGGDEHTYGIIINEYTNSATGHVNITFVIDGVEITMGSNTAGLNWGGIQNEDDRLQAGINGNYVTRSPLIVLTPEEFAAAWAYAQNLLDATTNGDFGYGLLGQNCVDFIQGILHAAGISQLLGDLISEDSPVRDYALLVDAMIEAGTYAVLDTVGEILATLGMVGNDIVNAFEDAFNDFANGDFAGGIAALWNGFTETVDDIWDGLMDIFGFTDPEDFEFDYSDEDWENDFWSQMDDFEWDYDNAEDFYDEDWWSFEEEWEEWEEWFECEYGYLDPVVLDLDGDGLTFKAAMDSTAFARSANGEELLQLGWVGSGEGVLALDLNGNGTVDDLSEVNFFRAFEGARSDIQALTALDGNHDGVLDASDQAFASLLVWQDANGNGVCDPGEAKGLTEAGIKALATTYERAVYLAEGNIVSASGAFETLAGEVRAMVNVDLAIAGAADTVVSFAGDAAGVSVVIDQSMVGSNAGRIAVVGGSGDDRIEVSLSTASILIGGDGADQLIGGGGNDALVGCAGADVFVVSAKGGHDVVRDFDSEEGDRLSSESFDGLDFEDILAMSRDVAGSVVITFDAENDVTIANVAVADLSADWFLLAA